MNTVGMRVIIADNNLQDRESKQKTMASMGMEVILATGNGSKALEAIRSEKPDIVVMDMILPGIDGIGILEEINQADYILKKPIFIIETALRMENLVDEAIQAGADYYMMKPVSNTMLIKRMAQLMHKNDAEKTKMQTVVCNEIPKEREKENKEHRNMSEGCSFCGDLEIDVTNILLEIGIPAHIKGYQIYQGRYCNGVL